MTVPEDRKCCLEMARQVDYECDVHPTDDCPDKVIQYTRRFDEYTIPIRDGGSYNEFTSTPPRLVCEDSGTVLNPVTKNTFLPDAIDPDELCETLAENGY